LDPSRLLPTGETLILQELGGFRQVGGSTAVVPHFARTSTTKVTKAHEGKARKNKNYAALPITGCAQWLQRRASMGISLRHSGHFLVVGSAGTGALRMRDTRAFTGVTTKK
jgi:hypothetical protein